MNEELQMTDEEREGVKMIISLQREIGLVETESTALAGWRSMDANQQMTTRFFYEALYEKKGK